MDTTRPPTTSTIVNTHKVFERDSLEELQSRRMGQDVVHLGLDSSIPASSYPLT